MPIEKKESIGKNTEVKLTFGRHTDKEDSKVVETDGSGVSKALISEEGGERAQNFGETLTDRKFNKEYVTSSERTTQTLKRVLAGAKIDFKEEDLASYFNFPGLELKGELGKKYMEIINQNKDRFLKELYPGKEFNELTAREQGIVVDAGGDLALDWYLQNDKKAPYPDAQSPYDFASIAAYKLNRLINLGDHMPNGKTVDLLSIGHKTSTEPLLKYCLVQEENGNKKVGFDKLEEIGGGLQTMEDWTLVARNDAEGNKNLKIILRGKEYDLDMDKLKEMAKHGGEILGKEERKIDL